MTRGIRGSSIFISSSFVRDDCSIAKQASAICRLSAGVRPSLIGLPTYTKKPAMSSTTTPRTIRIYLPMLFNVRPSDLAFQIRSSLMHDHCSFQSELLDFMAQFKIQGVMGVDTELGTTVWSSSSNRFAHAQNIVRRIPKSPIELMTFLFDVRIGKFIFGQPAARNSGAASFTMAFAYDLKGYLHSLTRHRRARHGKRTLN